MISSVASRADVWSAEPLDYRRDRPIFIQYVNPEILSCYGREVKVDHAHDVFVRALDATRLALLLTDGNLIIPASYIFEIPWFPYFLQCVEPLIRLGVIRYTAPMPDLAGYQALKANEYRRDKNNPYLSTKLRGISADQDFGWTARRGTSTAYDIAEMWRTALQRGGDLHPVLRRVVQLSRRSAGRTEAAMARVPERLDGQAFIQRFVERTIPVRLPEPESRAVALFLSRAYLRSYIVDLDASILTNTPVGELSCGLDPVAADMTGRLLSARRIELLLKWIELHHYVHRLATWEELERLRSSPEFGLIITALYENRSTIGLQLAVLRAKRSKDLKRAFTYADAHDTVLAVADELII